jgi:hypothetical protein
MALEQLWLEIYFTLVRPKNNIELRQWRQASGLPYFASLPLLLWLRHCATSWKVAGSIPDGIIGIFQWHNPSGRTVALESTQPLA